MAVSILPDSLESVDGEEVGGCEVKAQKGYCRRHPDTKLPPSALAHRLSTGCWRCKKAIQLGSRPKRAARWDSEFIACTRHSERRVSRSWYVRKGRKVCASCASRNANGTLRPVMRRRRQIYVQKDMARGNNKIRAVRWRQKMIAVHGTAFLEQENFRAKTRNLTLRIQENRI